MHRSVIAGLAFAVAMAAVPTTSAATPVRSPSSRGARAGEQRASHRTDAPAARIVTRPADAPRPPRASAPVGHSPSASTRSTHPRSPALTATACAPSGLDPTSPSAATLNGWTVTVDVQSGHWQIVPPGGVDPVLSGPGACEARPGGPASSVRVATGTPFIVRAFGAFRVELEGGLSHTTWHPVSGGTGTLTRETTALTLMWPSADLEAGELGLRFSASGSRDLEVELIATHPSATGGEISMIAQDGEAFFGLGTQVVGLELRGRTYPLWAQEQGIGKPEGIGLFPLTNLPEAAYAPMGVWHSSAGYSAIVTQDSYQEIDLAETYDDRIALRAYGSMPGFVLVPGETPRARLAAITDYTGRLQQPAPWVFAPWNDAFGGPDRLWTVVDALRANDIPSSAIWSEDWIGEGESWSGGLTYSWLWSPDAYPTLPQDIETLHARGFAFLGYFNTFVPHTTPMWPEGLDGGYFIHKPDGGNFYFLDPMARVSSMVDLSNPDALAWMQDYLRIAIEEVGLDGWMADFAEWLPADAVMDSGEDGWAAHNRYPLEWQQLNRDAFEAASGGSLEPSDWAFFVRSGWASTQGGTAGISPTMWGGDQNTSWGQFDGLPSAVAIGANVGLAGVAIYGSDIAGYTHVYTPPTNKELYLRWASFGAFSPLMRTHHGLDECSNWAFDRDEETLQHFRRYANIHALLFPYLWERAGEAMSSGLPVMRHPWLVEPGRSGLWTGTEYEYFLGDDLLVGPVIEEGATTRSVTLPTDGWWPLFGKTPVTGGQTGAGSVYEVSIDAPITEIPVFVRPGTLLPLLGQRIDSFFGATEPGLLDLVDVAGFYTLALYPDASGGLRSTRVGTATVSGTGWTSTSIDWSQARVNGQTLAACDAVKASKSCLEPGGKVVQLVGASLELTVGAAKLTVTGSASQWLRVALAADAWGGWAAPTVVTDVDPDVPPPCE